MLTLTAPQKNDISQNLGGSKITGTLCCIDGPISN